MSTMHRYTRLAICMALLAACAKADKTASDSAAGTVDSAAMAPAPKAFAFARVTNSSGKRPRRRTSRRRSAPRQMQAFTFTRSSRANQVRLFSSSRQSNRTPTSTK